jgi:hypothetical protein
MHTFCSTSLCFCRFSFIRSSRPSTNTYKLLVLWNGNAHILESFQTLVCRVCAASLEVTC